MLKPPSIERISQTGLLRVSGSTLLSKFGASGETNWTDLFVHSKEERNIGDEDIRECLEIVPESIEVKQDFTSKKSVFSDLSGMVYRFVFIYSFTIQKDAIVVYII